MQPHLPIGPADPPRSPFPMLPIVTPDPPKRSERDKFGGLYYLGIIGLVVLVGLLGWFGYGAWALRAVWTNIYVLHKSGLPESDRVQAAYALSRDPRVNQRQYWDICLRKPLPGLARYVIAEALTAEAATADPRAYGVAVAKSEGWPDWLRLLLVRPMAYAASQGEVVSRPALVELAQHSDPAIALWSRYALAAEDDPAAAEALDRAAGGDGPFRELARLLRDALKAKGDERAQCLDRATLWLRTGHPEAAALWKGWKVEGERLVPVNAPAE